MIVAGDTVMLRAALGLAPRGASGRPVIGAVEATGGGTTFIVYEDGFRDSYPDAQIDQVMFQIVPPAAATADLFGRVVEFSEASTVPNFGSRARGPASLAVGLADPITGVSAGDIVGFETPLGYVVVPSTAVVSVPSA